MQTFDDGIRQAIKYTPPCDASWVQFSMSGAHIRRFVNPDWSIA